MFTVDLAGPGANPCSESQVQELTIALNRKNNQFETQITASTGLQKKLFIAQ